MGAAEDIARDLTVLVEGDFSNASLSGGFSGLALFFHEGARTGILPGASSLADVCLDRAFSQVASSPQSPSFYGGFPGVAFAAQRMAPREERGLSAVDTLLESWVQRRPYRGDLDLVHGLVGLGTYGLSRLPHDGGARLVEGVVTALDSISEEYPQGVQWFTGPDLLRGRMSGKEGEGHYNLGMAHGLPGIIAFLAQALKAEQGGPRVISLLRGARASLLAEKSASAHPCFFPCWRQPGEPPPSARLAWCYGDLGVAASLLQAAQALGESADEARDLALQAADVSFRDSRVEDASLCHGAAGLAHQFSVLYHSTGESGLGEAALRWWKVALEQRQPGRGLGGYLFREVDEEGRMGWREIPGLLSGSAGVGLALLSALTSWEPVWDSMLLLRSPVVTLQD